MRGRVWQTAGIVFGGAILGTLAGELLARQWSLLGRFTSVRWSPSVDLGVISLSLNVSLKVNLLTIVGALLAFWWASRRRK